VIWKCGSRSIQQTPDEVTPVPAQGSSATTARVGTFPCGVALTVIGAVDADAAVATVVAVIPPSARVATPAVTIFGREKLGTGSPMNGRRRLRPHPLMACARAPRSVHGELDAALGNGSQTGSTVVRDPTLRLPAADQSR
jgi:hypothetical protein